MDDEFEEVIQDPEKLPDVLQARQGLQPQDAKARDYTKPSHPRNRKGRRTISATSAKEAS
jgi:hypothetical protein